MSSLQKHVVWLFLSVMLGAVSGRLAVRAVLNLLLGGTLFWGNIL